MRKHLLIFTSFFLFTIGTIYSQSCTTCSAVTSFTANLTSNPNNTYTVNSGRNGLCCQGSGSDRCVRFEVSVHPSATQIQFLVSTGNNGTWEINCLPPLYTPTSKPCLNGLTNFCITYCNPGGGTDTYTITTSTGLGTGADLNLRGDCTGSLTVSGLLESTINWTSVYPGAVGTYTNYLSCLSGCDTTEITPLAGAPAYIDYKVCGSAVGCVSTTYCDTQRVYITPALTFTINPAAPVLCSASSGSLALTTTVTGGNPPYTYSWSPGGVTTSSISVNTPGIYSVSINDNTSGCGAVTKTITVTSATTPTATASPSSQTLCSDQTTSITLSSNSGTTTYSWVTSQSGVTGASNGSGSSITQTLTTTGLSSGTVIYTITPADAGCSGNPVVVTVTVNPAPTMTTTPAAQSLCSGGTTSFSLTSNVSGTTYSWTATQTNATGAGAASGTLIAQSLTATTTSSGSVIYTITPTYNSCPGVTKTVSVTVNPAPTVTATPASQALCSGNTSSIALTGGVAGTTYSWAVAQTGVSGASVSSGTLISQTLSATGTSTGTAIYTITPTANGCNGTPVVVTITITPTPSITATPGSQSLCSGNTSSITLTSNVAGTTYSWTVAQTNITGATASTGSLIAQTLSTTTTSSGTAVYSITSSANSCGGSTQTVTVTLNPAPTVTATPASQPLCSGNTTSITLTGGVAGTTYSWTVTQTGISGASASSGTLISQALSATGTSTGTAIYTITPTANGCNGTPVIVTVTVTPAPTITATPGSQSLCSGNTSGIILTSNVAGTTYSWTVVQTNITGASVSTGSLIAQTLSTTSTSSGTAEYSITSSANGCGGSTQIVTVTVNPRPVMTSTNTAAICSGNSFSIALTSNVASTYTWIAGNNANTTGETTTTQSSTTLTDIITNSVTTSQIVNYTVTPTSTGGSCLGTSQTVSVTIRPAPTVAATPGSQSLCSGNTSSITLSSGVAGTTYSWTVTQTGISGASASSGTLISQALSSTGTSTGTAIYTITPTANGCNGTPVIVTVTVTPAPTITATPGSQSLCSGNTSSITLTSNVAGTTYSWTVAQTNITGATASTGSLIAQTLSTTTTSSGTAVYSITSSANSCGGSTQTVTVTLNPAPTVTATPASQSLCSGNTSSITLIGGVAGTTYSWTVTQTNVSGASAGTGSVVAQNLTATSSVQGNVSYTIIPTANGCAGMPIVVSVSVNPTPSLTVTPSSQALCSGSTTSLTSSSDVSGTTYSWTVSQTNASGASSGSGATITQTLTATTAGLGTAIYTITPSAASCLGTPIVVTVSVSPIPATPTPTNNGPVCVNGTLSLSTGTLSGASYNWSGPNSFTASIQNPTVTNIPFAGAGVYTVNVSVNGCNGPNKTTTVVVNSPPPTTLSISSNSPLCSTKTLSLSVATVPSATYSWSGPNSFNSTLQNPTITNASTLATGVYSITATVLGCGSSATETLAVIVNPTPVAPIAGNNGPLCVGATLNLTASGTATTYSWTGPGGFTDTNQDPTINNITLSQVGVYSVTATSSDGCISTRGTTTLVVNPIPATPTLSSNSPICVGQTLSLTTGSVSGAGYSWNGPNTYTSSIQNPSITNAGTLQTGTYSLNIIVNNCPSLAGTLDVSVNDAASTPTATAGIACFSDTLFLFANSTGGATFTWVGPNGFNSSIQDPFIPNVTLAANGIYTVIANNGCASTPGMVTVSVTPKPATPVASSNSPLCEGASLNLVASNTGTSYFWTGPNTFTAAVQNPTITTVSLSDAGVYSVTAMANGCSSDTRTLNIVINPIPITPAIGNTSPVCTGQSFNLTVTPVAGATYTWSGPNSYTNTIQTPTLTNVILSQAGTYSLIIEVNGCVSNSVAVTSVTINNTPSAPIAANNGPLCEGDNLNLTASETETSYNWSGPLGYTDLNQNPAINSILVTQSGTYSVTATTNGCTSPVATTTVVINLIPATPTASATTPVCVGQTVSLTTASVATASYNWSGPNSYTSSVQNPAITNASVTNSGTYSINIVVNGCSSSTGTIDVSVNDAAISPTVSSNSPVCSKDTLFLFANSDPGSIYTWSGPNGFNSILQNPFIANTSTLATGNYTVLANNGCSSIPSVISVTVNQTPATPVITSNSPVCLGSILNLSATFLVGGNYNWSGPNGFTASTQSVSIPNTTTSEQGTYSVSVTKDGCTSLVALRNVTVTIPPLANAGVNQTVCANNAMVALTGTVSGGTNTGIWSSAGSGTFTPDANTLITSYIPSNTDTAAGSVKLTLTSTNNGGCAASTSSISIIITDAPVAIAGSNFSVCANNANINLNGIVYGGSNSGTWLSSGGGIFTPDSNTLNAVYIPNPADVSSGLVTFTLTTTTNGQCLAVTSQMTVNITNAPVVFAGSDQITCKASPNASLSGTVSPSNAGIWETLGSGSFSPDPNSLNTTYIPSTADTSNGSVLLVLTSDNNGNCLAVTDTVKISFSDIPSVNAGSSQTVCANNSIVALTGTITGGGSAGIWTSSGTGTFTPGATLLNTSYIPSAIDTAAGIVTLTLTSTSGCVVVSDNISISITPAPFVVAGENIFVCANNAIATYSGSISGITNTGIWSTTGSGSFSPDDITLNGTYTPSPTDITNGSVFLILTSTNNSDCNIVVDSLRLIITPPPSAFAGNDTSICARNNLVLNGLIIGGTGAGIWSTSGTGTFTPGNSVLAATYIPSAADTTAHQVTLTLTSTNNGGCLAATDDLTLTITPAPTIFAGGDQIVCTDNNIVILNGEVTVASGMEWTTLGDGTFGSFNSSTTSYTIGTNDISNGQVKIVVTSTGNGDCVTVTDTVNIQIEAAPIVNAGNNQFICQGITVVNLNGNISGSTSTGTWTTLGSGNFGSLTNLSTTYTLSTADTTAGSVKLILTSTNNGSCNSVIDTLLIKITPIGFATVGNDTTVCSNDSIMSLSGVIFGGTGTGQWSSNGTGTFNPSNTALNTTYILSAADIATGNVMITLTPISCQPEADSLKIIINRMPGVNAGIDQTICSSVNAAALSGTVTGGSTTGVWTTLGSGDFSPDANTLNGIYTVSSADSLAGFVNLVLTSTNNGVCNEATDTVKIFITNSTTAFVGNDTTLCSTDSLALNGNIIGGTQGIWTSNGSGVFHPDNTSLNATYVPGSTDISTGGVIIKLTPTSGCQFIADSLTLTLNLAPTVNAGSPVSICASTSTVALNGTITGGGSTGVWTTLGIGSFSPDANTLNGVYTVSSADSLAGFVNLVLTSTNNGMCNATTDTVKIFISNSTTALVGNDTTICSMDSLALNGNIIGGSQGLWTSNGSGVFHPDNLSLNATYVPGTTDITNGSVIIKLTPTSGCQISADSLVLTLNLAPTVNAGPPVSAICASTNTVALNGTIIGGSTTGIWTTSGSGIFLPNDSTLNSTYQLSSADSTAGTVTLFLTTTHNGSCGSAKDSIKINSTTPAFAFVTNDFAVCANNASTVLSGTITGGVGEGQWTTNGSGSFIPNDTTMNPTYVPGAADISNGSVIIKLSPINACSPSADSLVLTITPSPTVSAGTDIVMCKALDPINLLGSINTIPNGAVWNTNGLGIFNPNDSTLNATYVPSISDSDTLFFVLTTTGNGLCNAVSDSMFVFRNAKPIADFTYANLCVGQSAAFNDGSSVGTSTIASWSWSFGDGNTSINQNPTNSYSVNGTYSVSLLVKNSKGCSDSITKVIRIHPTPVSNFSFATTCLNDSVRFVNSSSVSQGTIASMNWNFGDGDMSTIQNPAHLFDSVKVYNVALTVTSDSGCISVMTQTVNINPTPIAGFNIASSCGSLLVDLTDISTVSSGTVTNWNWTFGDANVSIAQNPTNTYSATGAYTITLQVQSNNGCIDTATAVVNLSQSVLAAYIPHGGTYNVNENVSFTNQSTGASGYEWDFGDGSSTDVTTNPSHGFTNPGNYSVTLIASNGSDCADTIAYVFEIKTSGFTVPGAFTPNGDGLNDEFSIIGGPFSSYELRVFNEWGHQIFISSLQSDKWDGTYKGASQPAGTYVYIFNGKVLDGEDVKLKGEVNIIR